ncbi:MAG: MoaD/ThiS family protein [Acidobacteriota bacterium]
MARLSFTTNLRRHLDSASADGLVIEGTTVRQILDRLLAAQPALRRHLVDPDGRLWSHITLFVGDTMLTDRVELSDPVGDADEIHVMQSLSGG